MAEHLKNLGETAGVIYQLLRYDGAVSLDWMCRTTGLPGSTVNRGIGWLAREGKLAVEKRSSGRDVRVRKAITSIARLLRSSGPMSVERIRSVTGLQTDIVNQGLGWLAREGKLAIATSRTMHRLPVGEVAGIIWRALHTHGPTPRKELCRATGLQENVADHGIGWLLREGKLVLEDRTGRRETTFKEAPDLTWQTAHLKWPALRQHLAESLGLSAGAVKQAGGNGAPNGMLFLSRGGMGRQVRIGEAAGLVWNALGSEKGATSKDLCKVTGLPLDIADQGIGWLAREGKLSIGTNRKGHDCLRLTASMAGC